jgi:hypothetical protein
VFQHLKQWWRTLDQIQVVINQAPVSITEGIFQKENQSIAQGVLYADITCQKRMLDR